MGRSVINFITHVYRERHTLSIQFECRPNEEIYKLPEIRFVQAINTHTHAGIGMLNLFRRQTQNGEN